MGSIKQYGTVFLGVAVMGLALFFSFESVFVNTLALLYVSGSGLLMAISAMIMWTLLAVTPNEEKREWKDVPEKHQFDKAYEKLSSVGMVLYMVVYHGWTVLWMNLFPSTIVQSLSALYVIVVVAMFAAIYRTRLLSIGR